MNAVAIRPSIVRSLTLSGLGVLALLATPLSSAALLFHTAQLFFLAQLGAGDVFTADSPGDPAAVVGSRLRVSLASDVLDSGGDARPVGLALLRADQSAAGQAMAHATGSWWFPVSGGIQVTRAAVFPAPRLELRHFPGGISRPVWLETQVRAVVRPWLGERGGIAVDPVSGVWAASADIPGLARIEQLLALIDNPEPTIPAMVVPAAPRGNSPVVRAEHWAHLSSALVEAGLDAVAVDPELMMATTPPLVIPAGPWRELPKRLMAVGATAAWFHGCLCISASGNSAGGSPVAAPQDRLHPAAGARLTALPIGHLLKRDTTAHSLAVAITAEVEPQVWGQPGFGIVTPPIGTHLIISADPRTIFRVLAWMRQRESRPVIAEVP